MVNESLLKRAIIAGASSALKMKAENFKLSDAEVIQSVNREIKSILNKIDRD